MYLLFFNYATKSKNNICRYMSNYKSARVCKLNKTNIRRNSKKIENSYRNSYRNRENKL